MHLTIAFIGETERIADLKALLDTINFNSFVLKLNGIDKFSHNRGDLYWIQTESSRELNELVEDIRRKLKDNSFDIDTKKFLPHITIARDAVITNQISGIKIFTESAVQKISLMRSDKINGRLVYSEVYAAWAHK